MTVKKITSGLTREEQIRIVAATLDGKKIGQRFSYVTSRSKQTATEIVDGQRKLK